MFNIGVREVLVTLEELFDTQEVELGEFVVEIKAVVVCACIVELLVVVVGACVVEILVVVVGACVV
jgi:hypothetical protein